MMLVLIPGLVVLAVMLLLILAVRRWPGRVWRRP